MDVMSEPRRLHFTTIGPMGKEKKKKSSLPPTIRFTLALRESNDKTCPEFSYADLMKNALGDCKHAEPGDYDVEDQNENERLVALARSFEERYGPKHSKTQSKRCDAIQDLVDLGDGYDETDPFVDNSEAYDELVPACLTTKLGGFYINSGVLDFRDVSDDSSGDFVNSPIKKKKKSKRVVIASDTESDGEMKKKIPKIKKLKDGINKERRKKSSGDKEFKKPRKPTNKDLLRKKSSSTVKELLKQQTVTLPVPPIIPTTPTTPIPIPTPISPTASTTPTTPSPIPPILTPPPTIIITTTTASSTTITNTTSASTSNNNGHTSDPNGNNYPITTNSGLLSQDRSSSSSSGYMGTVTAVTHIPIGTPENDTIKMESGLTGSQPFNSVKEDSNSREAYKPLDPESIPKLSEGIPDPLEKTITQLKQAAEDSVEGKCKFFTPEVNKMLLEIETESRLLNCSQRSSIYAHLAAFLPCSKETLLKRAKKLILTQQDDKLKEPTQRLRDAINEEMPAQLEKYKNEYHGTSLENPNPNPDNTEMKEEGSSESDEDKPTEGDKNEKCLIKKTFEWNDKIRSLLCDIVKLKLESYGMSKLRAQSAEEYLKSFLKMEVKPLWPKGWMHVRLLFKESRSVHNKMTLYKAKKVPLVNKPQLSISVGNVPNANPKDPSSHSNNSSTNIRIDLASGLQNANTDVTPILTALANEMMDQSPTAPEKVSENKSLWNLLEYPDSQQHQSQTFGESGTINSTPIGQMPMYFSHTSPEGAIKGERHSPNESIKESPGSSAIGTPMYHHGLSTPNMNPVSVLSTQSTSPQISPTMPSVKASYPQLSPTTTTPTSTKQGISSVNIGKTSLHSQAEFSMSNMCDSEHQNLPSQAVGGVAAALLAMHHPQQASTTGITGISDAMSQNYHSYVHKDSGSSMKLDSKHHQHNGQPASGTSPSTPKSLTLPSQVSPNYQNVIQKDSPPLMQNKLPAASQIQNVKVMAKTVGTKNDSPLPSVNPDKPQNAGNMSPPPGQFSPKDDCTNTYLAEFQRYAASRLKTPLGSQKVKMQHPIASTAVTLATAPVSKGIDVKPLSQQARSPYQLAAQHHLGKIDVPSLGQQSQHGVHQSLPQPQQQQKSMTLGMSQNIHPSNHPAKSHPSSHSPHQQHAKPWRPPPPQQSSQQHNRHQTMQQQQPPPQKSYSSPHMSMKPMSSSSPISQVVNYQAPQQQQLNLQKQQTHVKVQQVQQQPRTTLSLPQQKVKVDSVLKRHSTTSPTVQTVSSLTATRHPHHTQTSVMNTTNNGNKMITGGVASSSSSSRGGSGIHSLLSGSSNLSLQLPNSSLKHQNRSHCLESALTVSPSITTSATSASLGSISTGSAYKLPTISNITSSVGSTAHQHLSSSSSTSSSSSYSSSKLTSHAATTLPQHQQGMMRSQGPAGLQLRAVLPSKNSSSGGVGYTAVSASQGKSSAQTWNMSTNISPTSGTTLSSCKQTSSPLFSPPLYQQPQLQHGSATRLTTTSQNYSARNLPGLVLDKVQSPLSGSFPPSQLNQESARHSKSE